MNHPIYGYTVFKLSEVCHALINTSYRIACLAPMANVGIAT